MAAAVSSGSFLTEGMIVAPCTIKSLSGIANSYTSTLIVRAADVTVKETHKLVLVVSETLVQRAVKVIDNGHGYGGAYSSAGSVLLPQDENNSRHHRSDGRIVFHLHGYISQAVQAVGN